jgi:hypothetical protein
VSPPWLRVEGWCFDEEGRPVTGIRARCGTVVVEGVYGWDRPDVRRVLGGPAASEASGFGVALRLRPGMNRICLEAHVGPDWLPFRELEVTCPWPAFAAGFSQRFLARLARDTGWPMFYRRLAPTHREFLFRRNEQNRHPLALVPQHAPQPVVRERYPAAPGADSADPKLLIVTPSLQQGEYLEPAIESVLRQEGVRVEYAVEDGGSTDRTVSILERNASRITHVRSGPDAGQADAINRGFAQLTGGPADVMAYLNADDLYLPGALRFVTGYFAANPEVDVIFGHRVLIDASGSEVGRWFTPRGCTGSDLNWFDLVPQETLFWRKRIWDRVGGIDARYQYAMDWDLLLRFRAAGARFARIPWFLAAFRLHPEQKSRTRVMKEGAAESEEIRRRAVGGVPDPDEFSWRMLRAQFEALRLRDSFGKGVRL